MIKFTQLTEKLKYPPNCKATLSTLHSEIITYVVNNFQNTNRYKSKVVGILNTISYYIVFNNSLPTDWCASNPFENIEFIDSTVCETELGKLFLHVREISWDVEETIKTPIINNDVNVVQSRNQPISKIEAQIDESVSETIKSISSPVSEDKLNFWNAIDVDVNVKPTPKDHLYIKPPSIPQFDNKNPWMQQIINNTIYTIYKSLPEIPLNQSQISVTTDVNRMTTSDFLKLYPNCFIHTRSTTMYEEHDGLTLDPDVGIILPITGFSPKQIKDNIIKYPHLFKLLRNVDGKIVSFYSNIEIDGELYKTLDIWDTLPDSKKMPRNAEFIKEYVVRRYLLERDIKHIKHNYPMFGTLEPFLTLFTIPDEYIRLGYKDVVGQAKQCVKARVSYKRSRNPIMRMVDSK
jgi:hypothetical protein